MTKKASLVAKYDLLKECPWVLFELSKKEVLPGSTVEIRLWAAEHDMLEPYALFKGAQNMGAGAYEFYSDRECSEELDFAEKSSFQLKRPIASIISATAVSDIMYIDEVSNLPVVWAARGTNVSSMLVQSGGSCLSSFDGKVLYGTIRCTYEHAPWKRYWTWQVGQHDSGTHWFFWYKNGELNHKFSVQLPAWSGLFPGEKKDILLKIVDAKTKAPVPHAKVYLNGVHRGTSDTQGNIFIYDIAMGTYDMKIVAPNYIDSDQDSLSNDVLVVR